MSDIKCFDDNLGQDVLASLADISNKLNADIQSEFQEG